MGRALGLNIGGAAELRTPIPNTCRTERQDWRQQVGRPVVSLLSFKNTGNYFRRLECSQQTLTT